MTEEYKSVEQRIWDNTKEIRNLGSEFVKTFYGTAITPFRMPTFARKCYNHQSYWHKTNPKERATFPSRTFGFLAGFITDISLLVYTVGRFTENNPTPAIVLATTLALTNIASGIYEASRASSRSDLEKRIDQTKSSVTA